jgi:hypothetical protein
LSFDDVVEEGEEGTIKPCANTDKRQNQGANMNSYTILIKTLLILLFISYSLEDEADQNEVQEITKDTNQQ